MRSLKLAYMHFTFGLRIACAVAAQAALALFAPVDWRASFARIRADGGRGGAR